MALKKNNPSGITGQGAHLIALIMLFLIGAIVGSFFAANISGVGSAYIEQFLLSSGTSSFLGIAQSMCLELVLMLLVFISAFFSFGLILAPLALSLKGFMLSMLVSIFVKTYGLAGYAVSLALIMLGGFMSVTCLMLVALQAMSLAHQRAALGRGRRVFIDRAYFLSSGICLALTLLSAVLNCYVTPLVGRMVVSLS